MRLGRGRALAWSPKGDAVLASKDEFTFVVVPVGAGTLRELPHAGMLAQFGWFAPDGGRVLINGRVGDKPYRFSWIDESGAVRPAGPPPVGVSQKSMIDRMPRPWTVPALASEPTLSRLALV